VSPSGDNLIRSRRCGIAAHDPLVSPICDIQLIEISSDVLAGQYLSPGGDSIAAGCRIRCALRPL
jgi:hypothetical protein